MSDSDSDAILIAEVTHLRQLVRQLLQACEGLMDPSHECGANCDMTKPCPIGEQARAAIAAAKGAAR